MLDKFAIEDYGRAGYTLMLSAGTAVFDCYRERWPLARRILVLAGPGNNGGDGYVVACLATEAGHQVDLIGFGETAAGGDADRFRQQWLTVGGKVIEPTEVEPGEQLFTQYDLVVDALLGTGLSRSPAEPMSTWIDAVNHSGLPCISVDVPSGLNSDTGAVPGVAIRAQATVTFIGRKQGLYTGQAAQQSGNVFFDDLGVPTEVYRQLAANARLLTWGNRRLPMFLPRQRSSHKGNHGHLLLIAGGSGMAGAAIIAGSAALRAGCGLVSAAVHPANVAAVVNARPEMMVHGVSNAADLTNLLERADVVAIGPLHNDNWILTPHVGEAARLLYSDVEEVEQNRFEAVSALLKRYSGTILLKGAGTLIHSRAVLPTVVQGGNPGMASGGMGDALTGVIGAFLAQGLDQDNAAILGAAAHGWAGDLAASENGERGMLASDLIARLPQIINGIHQQPEPESNGSAHSIFGR